MLMSASAATWPIPSYRSNDMATTHNEAHYEGCILCLSRHSLNN